MEDPAGSENGRFSDTSQTATVTGVIRRDGVSTTLILAGLAALVGAVLIAVVLDGGSASKSVGDRDHPVALAPTVDRQSDGTLVVPLPLLAAERYVANPSAVSLRALVESVGGLDAVTVGEAEGAFDLVRFDPKDTNRLLASLRSSYGAAENQAANELWMIGLDGLVQTLWAPDMPHDFVHFNVDGTITMWVRPDGGSSFGPRSAVLLDNDGSPTSSSEPIYASRSTVAGGSVFALTGDGDYYSDDQDFEELIAGGGATRRLDAGSTYEWVDNPTSELLVAFPRDGETGTAVWDAATWRRLADHPLAGRSYRRVAISGDERVAVGITLDGELQQLDLVTGQVLSVFGSVDAVGIDQPITLNHNGTTAITVERSGRVSLWWVGDDIPIASVAADAAQPRWVSERYGARTASAVADDGTRIALRLPAKPQVPVTWVVVDTTPAGWIQRACDLAARSLTPEERAALGLSAAPTACR